VPPELENDPTALSVTPTILEVFLSNVCNLACTYCVDLNSSQIEQENNKFGLFD
jgi:sulfatase maturation enzyme AslB (radical SAM superfamily)